MKYGLLERKMAIFRFDCDTPGTTVTLLKQDWQPSSTDLPIIEPPGLSTNRQWYLFKKIRPFCEERYQDRCCPLPSVPRAQRTPGVTPSTTPCPSPPRPPTRSCGPPGCPPEKRARTCRNCGGSGHDKRTCKNQSSSH